MATYPALPTPPDGWTLEYIKNDDVDKHVPLVTTSTGDQNRWGGFVDENGVIVTPLVDVDDSTTPTWYYSDDDGATWAEATAVNTGFTATWTQLGGNCVYVPSENLVILTPDGGNTVAAFTWNSGTKTMTYANSAAVNNCDIGYAGVIVVETATDIYATFTSNDFSTTDDWKIATFKYVRATGVCTGNSALVNSDIEGAGEEPYTFAASVDRVISPVTSLSSANEVVGYTIGFVNGVHYTVYWDNTAQYFEMAAIATNPRPANVASRDAMNTVQDDTLGEVWNYGERTSGATYGWYYGNASDLDNTTSWTEAHFIDKAFAFGNGEYQSSRYSETEGVFYHMFQGVAAGTYGIDIILVEYDTASKATSHTETALGYSAGVNISNTNSSWIRYHPIYDPNPGSEFIGFICRHHSSSDSQVSLYFGKGNVAGGFSFYGWGIPMGIA